MCAEDAPQVAIRGNGSIVIAARDASGLLEVTVVNGTSGNTTFTLAIPTHPAPAKMARSSKGR
jgi:hypothetical protein